MSLYGKFPHYEGDGKAVPLVDEWTYLIDTCAGVVDGPSAITAYANYDLAERAESIDGDVFIDIIHPHFKLTVSPREAKAIAKLLNDTADFIVEGKKKL